MNKINKTTRGFTMIELLIVMAVMGILAIFSFSNLTTTQKKARDGQRKSDLAQVKTALYLYKNDYNGLFPPDDTHGLINACTVPEVKDWGVDRLSCGSSTMVYMKTLPQDPLHKEDTGIPTYHYVQTGTGDGFCLWANLENSLDGDIDKSVIRCPVSICPSVADHNYVICSD